MERDGMTRRTFLGAGVLGGALAATDLRWPARVTAEARAAAAGAAAQAASELDEVTVVQLQEGLRSSQE